jgi:hypothetical protein
MGMSNALSITRTLPTFRLEALDGLLAKLGKKAAKLGVAAPSYTVTKTEARDMSEDKKYPHLVEFSTVEIAYEVIQKAGDWRFLAKIEAADEVDGVPRNKVSGFNLSAEHAKRYITTHMECEHCNINRKRNATYIVQDCNDKTLQVGSSCLQDFLGVDPAAAVNSIEFAARIEVIGEGDEWGYGGSAAARVMDLSDFAAATISIVSHNGFVKAQEAEAGNAIKTGNDVITLLLDNNPRMNDWRAKMAPTEAHKATAAEVLKRLNDRILNAYRTAPHTLDEFSFKTGISLNKGYVTAKDSQLMAAAVYFESVKIAKEAVKSNTVKNEFLPNVKVGDKVELTASIVLVKEVFSTFGTSRLIKLVTADGFPLTTFNSGQGDFITGTTVKVKGTVKSLDDNPRFGKATVLTRCKVVA